MHHWSFKGSYTASHHCPLTLALGVTESFMKFRHPYWARREIARLDPDVDFRRIAHLLFEVRYGDATFIHPLFA